MLKRPTLIVITSVILLLTPFIILVYNSSTTTKSKEFILHEPIIINSDEDLIELNLPGSGTPDDPFLIGNLTIYGDYEFGIYIANTTKFIVIANCSIDVLNIGIMCKNVSPYTIVIEHNDIANSEVGISLMHVSSVNVTDNNLSELTVVGILVYGSYNITLDNNSVNGSGYGVELLFSKKVTITNSTIAYNNYGLYVSATAVVNISLNLFQKNHNYAISFDVDANDSIVYYNDFIENNIGQPSQGYDDGKNNTWYNFLNWEGNYWSDWVGINSYPIAGSADSEDRYPLSKPVHEWLNMPTYRTQGEIILTILGLVVAVITLKIKKKIKNVKL